jgi:hypothetical protein
MAVGGAYRLRFMRPQPLSPLTADLHLNDAVAAQSGGE